MPARVFCLVSMDITLVAVASPAGHRTLRAAVTLR
jgi:hypothetical protein